ncbi:MAG: efflux RND transporter periplasmic adaptor subunit [Planctomycetales bacterium]|nr:efflux RND transporter periplasmic adaptor subunit [Planctomycetales bacterium]
MHKIDLPKWNPKIVSYDFYLVIQKVLCGSLFALLGGCNNPLIPPSAPDPMSPVRVQTVVAMQVPVVRSTRQPATIIAFYETQLRAKVSGYVTTVNADLGDIVSPGQQLAALAIPELEMKRQTLLSKIELSAAEEQGAVAGVSLAEATVASTKARLEQARSELGSAQALLEAAEAEFQRTDDLVQRGSLQSRVLDEVRKRRDVGLAARAAAESAEQSAAAEVSVAESQRNAAEAKLKVAAVQTKVAKHELAELDVLIQYGQITAPFAGIVTKRNVNLGDLVNGSTEHGSEPLFTVSQLSRVRIQIPVPETDAPFIGPGDSVSVSFPAFPAEPPIQAPVARVARSLDPSSRTMVVEVEIDNPEGKLLPGMFGDAQIDLGTETVANLLPSQAIRFDQNGKAFVYALDEEHKVTVIEVKTGLDTGTEIEIRSGIAPGQVVIDSHLQRFATGQIVQPL